MHIELHRLRADMHELYVDSHPIDDGPLPVQARHAARPA